MKTLDETYWNQRYLKGATGWDMGFASPPLTHYLDQITNRSIQLLIPGGGNGYEAVYAYQNGFQAVNLLDISLIPLEKFKKNYIFFPEVQILHQDFFRHEGSYDLILEQTFFCSLPPALRPAYVKKMKSLLKPGGKLVGLLFSKTFDREGPPFGGEVSEYRSLFEKSFYIKTLEPCTNSISAREGSELFMILEAQ